MFSNVGYSHFGDKHVDQKSNVDTKADITRLVEQLPACEHEGDQEKNEDTKQEQNGKHDATSLAQGTRTQAPQKLNN